MARDNNLERLDIAYEGLHVWVIRVRVFKPLCGNLVLFELLEELLRLLPANDKHQVTDEHLSLLDSLLDLREASLQIRLVLQNRFRECDLKAVRAVQTLQQRVILTSA